MNKKILYILTFLSISLVSCNVESQVDKVTVSKRQLLVNGNPYIIKGICYHPVPKGSENHRNFDNLTQDLGLMKEAGINTIRVYEPIDDLQVLNEIYKAGIKVIIGFGYNQNGVYDIESGTFIDYVKQYKNHSAILMWELGNEYNYHPDWFKGDIKNWYNQMNAAAALIKDTDPNHPTTTAHGDLPDNTALSIAKNIDVWGMNVYRWDDPAPIYKQWEKVSDKPMYLSEAGGDSYMKITKAGYQQGENQQAQADANDKILEDVFANTNIGSGVTLFSFLDGWWKAGNPNQQDTGGSAPNSSGVPYDGAPNEEYWGIVDIDRNKKKTFEVVKLRYKSSNN
ncbi:glycoside hydrolase family 2 TIM barrel-domain containing protein [Ichthyenterobacterium sp. W332]|uniref:Glycoside hydrolase family 2 TIM barrel-domain containing protein n=1 Tax=Microcosmobacter mediterraneus TaxID=3075607 RepID=A0ABU2YJV9_9FLAO|nr:glycoside hydrolase family 2 TIM barrel-domain containing protein [Ichthyenterobacterium sp. W332]MDT0558456.1 glycoside hydrolase family 2 TIM barrel-domain containing protein [Ichthyenterobacterium sp. W332]